MYTLHTYCRACGYARPGASGIKSVPTEKLMEVFDLGIQPLANDFRRDGEAHSGYAPLKVLFCPRCSLGQLSVVVDPCILYRHYSYVTSDSQTMTEHFKQLIFDIEHETEGKRVLEIGSNDGRLLRMMKDGGGYEVTGIDPAANLAALAESKGVPTHCAFFTPESALGLGQYDIVLARHVMSHIDDWQGFVRGLEAVSHHETVICIEVPYAGDTLKHGEFDTIYHEHLSYLTLSSVKALLQASDLYLYRVIRYSIHGGAVLLMLRHRQSAKKPADCFLEQIREVDWMLFADNARSQIERLKATVETLLGQGRRIAGLGASAKSTVWISACGFTRQHIAFIADSTPQKQYCFSPGTDIPIVDEGAITRDLPDYVIMWCWNFREEALAKFALPRSKGVKFIVPIPKIEVV